MLFDMNAIHELCKELGFHIQNRGDDKVAVELAASVSLLFVNYPSKNDCFVGFEGASWHAHDNLYFSSPHGHYIELGYLEILRGLKDGVVLIGEIRKKEKLVDRWLIHREFNDEFKFMEIGEEVRVYRCSTFQALL